MKAAILFNVLLISFFGLTACGGGGGTAAPAAPPPPVAVNLSLNSTSPVDGATHKSDYPIVAVFSEAVDDTLVDSSSFAVTDAAGNPVVGTFSFSGDKTVVIFTPTSELNGGESYTATLNTSLASTTGKNLAADVSWGFVANAAVNYSCTPAVPPAALGLDPFYQKYCDANGIPILGSINVVNTTLQKVWSQTMNMMKMRQDLHAEIAKQGTRIAVLASIETLTQIPEYSQFDNLYPEPFGPGSTWAEVKGLAAAPEYPVTVITEDNVGCAINDPLQGEYSLGHEFAHTVLNMGLDFFGTEGVTFNSNLTTTYNEAIAAGLWTDTYAAYNQYEYWAEGVQGWFDGNNQSTTSPTPDGVHNDINTQAELLVYDPALYSLISSIFPADWKPVACP